MSFFSEIKRDVGITDFEILSGFSYVNFCGKTLYVEGIVKIEKISFEQIIIRAKTATLEIVGQLKVDYITERSIVISGVIDNVSTRSIK